MDTISSLLIQSWTFYALAIVIILARLIFRRMMLKSFAGLQADDWIMLSLLLPLTASTFLAVPAATMKTKEQRKYRFVLEELQIVIEWLVKLCLLILYWRVFPIAVSLFQKRCIQAVAVVCTLAFIIAQVSLLSWCQPTHLDGSQCTTYHTIVSLTLSSLTTFLVLILPTPFIPTPRHLLLAFLTIIGVLTLTLCILARYSILTAPSSPTYLFYRTYEIILLIAFANLPFLASLVISTTPPRIREISRNTFFSRGGAHMSAPQWPRNSRVDLQDIESLPPRTSRLRSAATFTSKRTDSKVWSELGRDTDIQ